MADKKIQADEEIEPLASNEEPQTPKTDNIVVWEEEEFMEVGAAPKAEKDPEDSEVEEQDDESIN